MVPLRQQSISAVSVTRCGWAEQSKTTVSVTPSGTASTSWVAQHKRARRRAAKQFVA